MSLTAFSTPSPESSTTLASPQGDIAAVMLGTTQFTNAIVERRELTPVAAIREMQRRKLKAFAISSAFAPMSSDPEIHMAERIRRAIPDARITFSHEIGRSACWSVSAIEAGLDIVSGRHTRLKDVEGFAALAAKHKVY